MQERKREKLSALVQTTLAKFLKEELDIPLGCIVSISRVVLAGAAASAKVFVSIYPFSEARAIEKELKKLENKVSWHLKSRLSLRHGLMIHFVIDKGEIARERIEKILNNS